MPKPPPELVATLERLGLATAGQVARMGRRVRRLARDLPQFESVWVDALAQARVLTPFQAAELNAGRGELLRIGPYVLDERLTHPSHAACYRARNVESQQFARLVITESSGRQAEAIFGQLESLVGRAKLTPEDLERKVGWVKRSVAPPRFLPRLVGLATLDPPYTSSSATATTEGQQRQDAFCAFHQFGLITHAGMDGGRIFAAAPWTDGRTAAEWMVHHGRFPPEVVLEIARSMLVGLVELEAAGIVHGDVSTSNLLLTDRGETSLLWPGLRGIFRPEEGYAHADLLPEAFDSLAPERIAGGTPPDVASDIYACGCVWWHLLCGRPPLAGGNSLAKIRAAQLGGICEVRRYAPDAPASLAAAIASCLEQEPSRRPESMARLAALLGVPTRSGKEALARCFAQAGWPMVRWTTSARSIRKSRRKGLWPAIAVCCAAALVASLWPVWLNRSRTGAVGSPQSAVVASNVGGPAIWQTPDSPEMAHARDEASDVVPAAYQQVETTTKDLVLPAGGPLLVTSLDFQKGQCVRGPSGERATLFIPRAGLVVDKEDIRFENIDFVWGRAGDDDESEIAEPAIVQLRAGCVKFRGCSFQGDDMGLAASCTAIRWVHPVQGNDLETVLPSGRIQLTDCVMHRVGAGIECHTIGALGIELTNTLYLGAGPLARLDHCPQSDEPVSLALVQTTLRGSGPLLECVLPREEPRPGEIIIQATACVFAPRRGEPLLRFFGATMPEPLLRGVRWTGQGSLVTPHVPIFTWLGPNRFEQAIDESSLSMAGLVRSEVGFDDDQRDEPTASRILRWRAPLQSANPPGVAPDRLPMVD